MSRLTDKNITFAEKETLEMFQQEREHWQEFCIRMGRIENKLKELEDLEEQLGCPLDVRERAFDNGFYDVDGNHYFCEHYVPYLKEMHTRGLMDGTSKRFKLKDYKITWFLKKDKSE